MTPVEGTRVARQSRSAATEERIVAAAVELLAERPYEQVSVADIARAAGISVGGFYARFKSKAALLHWFQHDFVRGMRQLAVDRLESPELADADARTIIEEYFRLVIRAFRDHRALLRQGSAQSRSGRHPRMHREIAALNEDIHGRLKRLLLARASEIRHPEPTVAIDLGITFVSAALREQILFSEQCAHLEPMTDAALLSELTAAFSAYLGLARDTKKATT